MLFVKQEVIPNVENSFSHASCVLFTDLFLRNLAVRFLRLSFNHVTACVVFLWFLLSVFVFVRLEHACIFCCILKAHPGVSSQVKFHFMGHS